MKSLFRILVIVTIFIVFGLSFNLFYAKNNDDVLIGNSGGKPVKDTDLEITAEEPEERGYPRPKEGISVYIGMNQKKWLSDFGSPSRIEYSYYGYQWWIYEKDNQYIAAGQKDGKIVTVAVAGKGMNTAPFEIGESMESVYKKVSMQTEVEFEYEDGIYKFELFENDLNTQPLIPLGDIFAQLYFDNFKGELMFVRFLDKETLLLHRPYDLIYRGDLVEKEMEENEWIMADQSSERQIFDLTNLIRKSYGSNPLEWDAVVSEVAYEHSKDMQETQTFSHISEKFGDLSDRLSAKEVYYEVAGENIASQYVDSFSVIAGWMNSKSHRDTFLNKEFTHLGVGVYKKYFTQNFIRRSWEETEPEE